MQQWGACGRLHADQPYKKLSLLQVPSFGILMTGTEWLHYKFDPQSKTLYESRPVMLPLKKRVVAKGAHQLASPAVKLLLHVIQEQKKACKGYKQDR